MLHYPNSFDRINYKKKWVRVRRWIISFCCTRDLEKEGNAYNIKNVNIFLNTLEYSRLIHNKKRKYQQKFLFNKNCIFNQFRWLSDTCMCNNNYRYISTVFSPLWYRLSIQCASRPKLIHIQQFINFTCLAPLTADKSHQSVPSLIPDSHHFRYYKQLTRR